VVVWENTYPLGKYTITVSQKTGKGDSSASVFVIRDPLTSGKQVGQFSGTTSTQTPSFTNTITIGPAGTSSTAAATRRK